MADVLKIVFLIVGTLVVLVSYWLAAASLFPRLVAGARSAYTERPGRSTLVGAAVGVPLGAAGLALLQAASAAGKMLGMALLSVPLLLGLLGSAGLCERIGTGLPTEADERYPWRRVLRGGTVLGLTFLLPVIGWFAVLPWTITSGVGAAVLALRARRRQPALVAPAAATVATAA